MMVFVDPLRRNGWILRGRMVANCHLFTDQLDLSELHAIAEKIGMKAAWFQHDGTLPHYDLTERRKQAAIEAGAVPVGRREAVRLWRARRELVLASGLAARHTGRGP